MLQRFAPSDRIDPLVFLMLIPTAAAAALIAWPYQALVSACAGMGGKGLVVATFFTAAFGGICGAAAWFAVKWGRCRNPRAGWLIGALLGFIGVAASHVVAFRQAASGDANVTIAEYVEASQAVGWRVSRSSSQPDISGVFVYVVWALELLSVAWLGAFCGRAAARSPFCEDCGSWAGIELAKGKRACFGQSDLDRVRKAESLDDVLGHAADTEPSAKQHFEYLVHGCPRCGACATISVDHSAMEPYIKGGEREMRETVCKDLALGTHDSRRAVAAVKAMADREGR